MIAAKTVLRTAGDGYWSDKAQAVQVTGIVLNYCDEDESFGELCVFFNDTTWDTSKDGLIYTDTRFEGEMCDWLTTLGYDASDVGYSEQGMQGDDYVSCDVGAAFIASYKAKHADEFAAMYSEING